VTALGQRLSDASNRFYNRMRHRAAFEAAAQQGTAPDFEALRGHKYCLLVTFRADGRPVPTPVWFGLADGRAYVRTEAGTAKVKRIRRDPHVRVGPCDPRGKPKGPLAEGTAQVLPAAEEQRAERALQANYGLGRRLYEGALGGLVDAVYLEISPSQGAP
jgi:PPOX class probable F420-dependent enzyme